MYDVLSQSGRCIAVNTPVIHVVVKSVVVYFMLNGLNISQMSTPYSILGDRYR